MSGFNRRLPLQAPAASRSSRTSGRTAASRTSGATRRRRRRRSPYARARPRGRAGKAASAPSRPSRQAQMSCRRNSARHRRPRGPHAMTTLWRARPASRASRTTCRARRCAVPRARDARRQDAPPRQLCDRRGGGARPRASLAADDAELPMPQKRRSSGGEAPRRSRERRRATPRRRVAPPDGEVVAVAVAEVEAAPADALPSASADLREAMAPSLRPWRCPSPTFRCRSTPRCSRWARCRWI